MEGRTDFALQLLRRQQRRLRIAFLVKRLEIAGNRVEMLRLGGQLQLARAAEIAVDALFCNERLDRVDGIVQRMIERNRTLLAEFGLRAEIAVGEPVVQVPAIAA